MTELIFSLIGLAVGATLCALIVAIRKKRSAKLLVSADLQAKKILSEAIQNAAAVKKESLLEAKGSKSRHAPVF